MMTFRSRLIGGCLVFLVGSQLIYYGMLFNGNSSLQAPIWRLVSGIHNLIVYGFLASVICVAVFLLGSLALSFLRPESRTRESMTLPFDVVEQEQQIQAELEAKLQSQKQIELENAEKLRLEEIRKLEVIKEKRERSASAAANAALDDFL